MHIKLTTKRQATFPVAVCDELRLAPGDEIVLERRRLSGETVWILRCGTSDWSWIGSVKPRRRVSHDIGPIRASIARGRRRATR
jgi:bifunctional DNA-binding transcriptional regulator/antitoxin component of YhaV-PrlF toxin-antitoxin module